MKISQLQILNFKSYLGQHIIGPFHKHFTCIIGPNGNGKSNILDAMLFVFGFKSAKLRQDTLASLIHSSAYGQPDQAKVTVKFIEVKDLHQKSLYLSHNAKNFTAAESISVSRTVRRNGYSFYQLNEKKIQWQQLKDFLMNKDIDLEKNLFIILQGEVERLCQLSPQKLVEYLEYVSGSDQYVPKITQLQQDYVSQGVKCEQAKQKYHISKKVFSQQQKETFELLEHIGLRIKLVELSFLYTKKSALIRQKNLTKDKEKFQKISEEINKINSTLQGFLTEKQNFEKSMAANMSKAIELDKQITNVTKDITQLESVQKRKKQTELEFLIKDLQQKEKETEMVLKQKKQLSKIAQNEKELKQQSDEMQEMLIKVLETISDEELKKPIANLSSNHKSNSKKKNPTSHKTYIKLKSICKLKQQAEQVRVLISNQLSKELNDQQTRLRQTQEKYKKVIEKYGKNGQKFTSNEDVAVKLKLRIRNFTQALQQKEKELTVSISNLEEIKRRIKDCQSTKTNLSHQQKVLNEIKTANRAQLLLPQKQITTLREQMMLPPDLSGIISVITPQLDFVIVQNHQQARQIIQFLNVRKIGRMSFILKDQVNKLMNGINTQWKRGSVSKACQRIYDMARPIDKEYEKIWYWSVGNTLLADTLDEAMKVAYYETPHYRVITKNGEFIDMSGAMTKLPIQARSSQNQDRSLLQARLKVFQNKVDQESRKVSTAKKEKEQLIEQLNQLSSNTQEFSNIQQLKDHLHGLQHDIATISKALKNLQGQRANHQLTIKLKQKQVDDITKNIQFDETKARISFDQLLQLVEQYEKITTKIKKISISEEIIKVHQSKLQNYRSQMYAIDQKIFNHKSEIQAIIESIKQKRQQINQIQAKKRLIRDQISEIEQKLFLIDLDIKRVKGEIKHQDSLFKHKRGDIAQKQNAQTIKPKNQRKSINQNPNNNLSARQSISNAIMQSLVDQKSTLPDLLQQQKQLNQKISQTQTQLKIMNRLHETQLNALSKLFSFLVKKCEQGQAEVQSEKQKFLEQQMQMNLSQGSKLSRQGQKTEKKPEQENQKEQTFEQMLQRKHKKFIKFKDILFEYFESQNLVYTLQKTLKPKSKYSQTQSNPFLLINLCNHCFQNKLAPLSKIISLCYFNSWKIMNISPQDEYFFVNFLSKDQIGILTKDVVRDIPSHVAQKKYSQCSEQSNQSSNLQEKISSKQKSLQDTSRTDLFLLEHLSLQRMRFLYKLYEQKLQALQKNSRSMFMKSGKKENPLMARAFGLQKVTQAMTEPIDSQDPSMAKPLSYFSDPDFPLDPNELEMVQEYIKQKKNFCQLESYLQSVETSLNGIYKQLLGLRQARNTCFLNTFNLINIQVNKIYNFLTKGSAEINLVNSINPLEGLEFSVRPFNKSWKSVNLLSGGQKTLTSLSLIFACQQVRKFPFYFMDEIDAALDYRNVTNLGKYIKDKQQVQHIVISLRKNMYEQCDSLVCIYKVNDVSRTMKVDMKDLYVGDKRGATSRKVIRTSNKVAEKKEVKDDQVNLGVKEEKATAHQNVIQQLSQTSTLTMLSKK